MDFSGILREIDAEIERLEQIRGIVAALSGPVLPRAERITQMAQAELVEAKVQQPELVVLPPKKKREYTRRARHAAETPRALATAIPDRPVFVPRGAAVEAAPAVKQEPVEPEVSAEELEAAMRRRLLGDAA